MNNMNNKINEKKKMRKFNMFYYVNRLVNVDNTNGLNVTTVDVVQEIFLSPDKCYNYLIKQISELKDVLWEYTNKTDFISKINYLKDKLKEINKYFPDNIIFKYDFFENDKSGAAGREFYMKLVMKTNENGSMRLDANTKTVIDKDCIIKNNQNLYGIYIVPLDFDTNKINN